MGQPTDADALLFISPRGLLSALVPLNNGLQGDYLLAVLEERSVCMAVGTAGPGYIGKI